MNYSFSDPEFSCDIALNHYMHSSFLCCCLKVSFCCLFWAPAVLDGVERLTAEEMDERRQQNMAYEYLCHLEEAKR